MKRCLLILLALNMAGLSHAQLVQNALTRELRRIFPELGQGYLDLNRNGRPDQADDLDERVPESSIKDSEIQGQEILDFILENFRYLETEKLVPFTTAVRWRVLTRMRFRPALWMFRSTLPCSC